MKLDKAIEILSIMREINFIDKCPDRKNAIKLGTEALKVVEKWRWEHRDLGFLLLPGETEE